jgi:long-chain-fatty-acid--[acyl-carrier-protein] ligase
MIILSSTLAVGLLVKKRSRIFSLFLFALARLLLSLRYKIEVKGLENIPKRGGMLFLPNHPAEIDPVILMCFLGPKYFPRPMVVEHFYRLKGFQWILDAIGVLPIPTMEEKANIWRGKEVAKIFGDVKACIQAGDNFLIYPSGKLKGSGLELLGGASFVHSLLCECKGIHVVLVRSTGLWGSSFSRAPTGKSPDFAKTLSFNFLKILKNFVFFIPKRQVLIEVEEAPQQLPIGASRLQFNKFLEDWYNRYPSVGAEPLNLVSYSRWKEEYIPMRSALSSGISSSDVGQVQVPSAVELLVKEELAKLAKIEIEKVSRKSNLSTDLGLDSLDVANLHIFLDRKFNVNEFAPGELQTVEEVLEAIAGHKKKVEQVVHHPKSFSWPSEPLRKRVHPPIGKTIQEAFLQSCDLMARYAAAADATVGVVKYRKMKMMALALANKIRDLPGDRIGIMLPSSVGAYVTILAALLANKVPVMLNWTNGVRGLDHAADLAKISSVLTSRLFLDRAEIRTLGKIESSLVYLEDFKHSLQFSDKIKALWKSFKKAPTLIREYALDHIASSDPAVILFTSGTESLPKAVILSHENILFNQKAALSLVKFRRRDCLYAVLPPFHSFGFSITGLLPLLSGLKVFYAPDPNNSRGMADDIASVKPSFFICAPSFIRSLFAVADPKSLQSLRLIVSGAEKAPKEIIDYISLNLPNAKFLEGYGITECAPVVTLCRPHEKSFGVGKPLPGVELCFVDPVTKEKMPIGEPGQICIRGANVFSGYLGSKDYPFIEFDDKKWYLSGDMGYQDDKGHLHLSGRLKRFVKVGGEMISLGGLEEEISLFATERRLAGNEGKGACLALSIKERDSERPELVLFTTFPVVREEINAFLKDAGWGRIIKIAEVHQLSEIPLTGVGKTDYRFLDEKYLSG